jgi:hypothetical protein
MPAVLLSPATHGSLDRRRYIRTGPDEAEGFQTAADPNDSHGLILGAISSHLREIVAPMLQYSRVTS